MRIELGNRLEEMPNVISALGKFSAASKLDARASRAAELALDELLTNTISYGYPDAGQHTILVELSIEKSTLKIVITDDGMAFNPFDKEPPPRIQTLEDQELGGLGIHLVKEFMDECSYQRRDHSNVVTLQKSISQD